MQKLQPSAGRDKKNKQKKGPELKTRLWLERAHQSSGWVYWSPPGPEEKATVGFLTVRGAIDGTRQRLAVMLLLPSDSS